MSMSGIRTKLATALSVISSIRVYTTVPTVPSDNVFVVVLPRNGNWNLNLPRSAAEIEWQVILYIKRGGTIEEAQTTLDGYLDTTGTSSVKAIIENYTGYKTDCNYAYVKSWENYGELKIGSISHLACIFTVVTR